VTVDANLHRIPDKDLRRESVAEKVMFHNPCSLRIWSVSEIMLQKRKPY